MSHFNETIAALATPVGTSALAVVRASGAECARIFIELFATTPVPRFAKRGDYHTVDGALLDDVIAVFFAGPRSFTGEDSLEISCHGNPLVAQKIVEDFFARGCIAAEPGEFTRRAFLNGRLDLSQAEAVIDLIQARSERALVVANQQLRGGLGKMLSTLAEELLDLLARVEAYIDFPEEDLPAEDRSLIRRGLERTAASAGRLLATQHYGALLRDGIKTVILGEPNAGKSSLLNWMVGSDRALVSPEPGTTRDFIEERINLGLHCIRLIDTAGLNPSPTPLEELGMQKTLERVEEADLFLLVLDPRRPVPDLPRKVCEKLSAVNTIVVLNKIDLWDHAAVWNAATLPYPMQIRASALNGEGMGEVSEAIVNYAEKIRVEVGGETLAINARHAEALVRAKSCLSAALDKVSDPHQVELLASDMRGALDALGEIGGRIDNERMLDRLFASFCIGK